MRCLWRGWVVLCAAGGLPLAAADLETQHALEATLPLTPRLDLTLHSRLRTRPGSLGLYQVRGGPILNWDWKRRISLLGGYYYSQQESSELDFLAGHRAFGGVEGTALQNRKATLDVRGVAERFFQDDASDFTRTRLRFRMSARGNLAPYTSHELFFDVSGFRSVRLSAGVRWNAIRNIQLDMGYFYEARAARTGPDRHMWLTSIHYKRTGRRSDPDI